MAANLWALVRTEVSLPHLVPRITSVLRGTIHKDSSTIKSGLLHFHGMFFASRVCLLSSRARRCQRQLAKTWRYPSLKRESESNVTCNVHQMDGTWASVRFLSSKLSDDDLRRSIEKITENFMEARELMDDAKSSHGTVYFSDDMMEAREAVKQTLEDYRLLLENASEEQRQSVQRTIGLRMEELKAQQRSLDELSRE